MPDKKLPRGALVQAVYEIIEKDGEVTGEVLAEKMGTTVGSAMQTLYRMCNTGLIRSEYYWGTDVRGHRVNRAKYVAGHGRRKPAAPKITEERREKNRQYQREYYRRKRSKGFRKTAGKSKNGTGWIHEKLDVQQRIAQAIPVLFPNFDPSNEEHLAWLTYTIEVMSHG